MAANRQNPAAARKAGAAKIAALAELVKETEKAQAKALDAVADCALSLAKASPAEPPAPPQKANKIH